ncbi:MAG: hypothetical protein CVT48_06790 [Thermoplasmata archaeon HGW-Thermoplasmata-1]|nr:MAG: hypothetical protein CVT48_06790 [Thermoplasmata archaeon HGW-Thermoplasmata-1]
MSDSGKEMSACLKVPKPLAERLRRLLQENGMLRPDLKVGREEDFVLLPLEPSFAEFGALEGFLPDAAAGGTACAAELAEGEFEKMKVAVNYKDLAQVPPALKNLLPSSFDIVGDIAIIKLQDELLPYCEEIGKAMLKALKTVRVVCLDGGVKGEFRLRDLKIIAGEQRTETTQREYGINITVDIAKAYYSPRLAAARGAVVPQVKEGAVVVDMFGGVAPFGVMIAKRAKPSKVYSIDLNPDAVDYALRNAKNNGVENRVEPICGDARDVVAALASKGIRADHVIMNLPHSAYEFFPDALSISKNGTVVHYFEILDRNEIDARIGLLGELAAKAGFAAELFSLKEIRSYSPSDVNIAVDLLLS